MVTFVGADCLNSIVSTATGAILYQIGDAVSGVVESDNAQAWFPTGLVSRAAVATQGQPSCQATGLRLGDQDIILATQDLRGTAIQGNLGAGETCVFAPGSQASIFLKSTGGVTAMTTDDNTPTGNAVYISLSPTEHRFHAPFGDAWHDQTGLHLRTWHGAKLDMGGLGLPAPFNVYNSAITIAADIVSIDAAVLKLGRVGATTPAQAVVQALPLSVVMTSLDAALASVNALCNGVAAVLTALSTPPSPPAPITNATLATALTAAGIPGLVAAATSAVGSAGTAVATVNAPTATGGCSTVTAIS